MASSHPVLSFYYLFYVMLMGGRDALPSSVVPWLPRVFVLHQLRVLRCQFQSCSNCEVQPNYFPTTTANHEFIVQPRRGTTRWTHALQMYICC